jgi:hypothetical protein
MRSMRKTFITLALVTVVAIVAGPATAGGNGKGGGGSRRVSGSFSLVLLSSSDSAAHYGQDVTFQVTSNAYHPMVTLTCYPPEGGADWLTNQTVGFYSGWPWSQVFPLSSWKWTGGAANCNAELYYTDHKGSKRTLDSLSFPVYA